MLYQYLDNVGCTYIVRTANSVYRVRVLKATAKGAMVELSGTHTIRGVALDGMVRVGQCLHIVDPITYRYVRTSPVVSIE